MITINKLNESYLHLRCNKAISLEISEYFSFEVPNAKFVRKQMKYKWDGIIRLARLTKYGYIEFPLGLLTHLEKFASDRSYELDFNYNTDISKLNESYFNNYVKSLNLQTGGNELIPRDYQIDGVRSFLEKKRRVLLSPTSSGKSLILYIALRFLLDSGCKKGLLLVPNVSLCHQLLSDFVDYSTANEWIATDHIHTIYAGKDKIASQEVYLSTWQSMHTLIREKNHNYFSKFDFIICDEVHLFSSKETSVILNACINASYRLGVTGTLNGSNLHALSLEGLFGDIKKVTTTKELMDTNQIANLKIKSIVLKYPEYIREECRKFDYQTEIKYIINNHARNRFLVNLVLHLKGNTLLMFQYVEQHGEILYKMLTESKNLEKKKVYLIHGEIKALEREEIRKSMETEDDVILIGSVGTVSTGTNIKNLHNIVFASPSKSRIRNLQAIGRVLRKHDSKTTAVLYDIADDLRYKSHTNYTMLHLFERLKIYDSEKFDYKISKVDFLYKST